MEDFDEKPIDLTKPETHSTEVLLSTIEELKKTKKQLKIAVDALEIIEKKSDKFDDSWGVQEQLDFIKAEAQSVLYNIKELEK